VTAAEVATDWGLMVFLETRGLFMSLVIHYWIGDVQESQGVSASDLYGVGLNSTHSLTLVFVGMMLKRRCFLVEKGESTYSVTLLLGSSCHLKARVHSMWIVPSCHIVRSS